MKWMEFGLRHRDDKNPFVRASARLILAVLKKWADREERRLNRNRQNLSGKPDLEEMLRYLKENDRHS